VYYDDAIWFHSQTGDRGKLLSQSSRLTLSDLQSGEPYVTTGKKLETPAHHFYVKTNLMKEGGI
jgi:hypothetical protein